MDDKVADVLGSATPLLPPWSSRSEAPGDEQVWKEAPSSKERERCTRTLRNSDDERVLALELRACDELDDGAATNGSDMEKRRRG